MLYVIPDTLLEVALNTINMVVSFIGAKRHIQQYIRYNV
jgi:hypothetical protein